MENKTYSWRWQLAQFLELRWWKRYLQQQDWNTYLAAKRKYWRKVLKEMDLSLSTEERILDAGCGPAGIFTILPNQNITAIDPLIEFYENNLPGFQRDQFPKVHFQALMLEQLQEVSVYDLVFCLNAINHVADLNLAMQRLARCLKSEGLMVISIDVHRFKFLKFVFRLLPGDALHPQQDDLQDYLSLLQKYGLEIQKKLVLKKGWIFNYVAIKAKKNGSSTCNGDEPSQ